uniref:Uncharacterized protein n=1 Tax=Glossina austeni TaxID=7395 RepID=A0A1A9UNL9_GLOAU
MQNWPGHLPNEELTKIADNIWKVLQRNQIALLPHNSNIPQTFQNFTTSTTTLCESFHQLRLEVNAIKKRMDDREFLNRRQSSFWKQSHKMWETDQFSARDEN